MPVHIALVNQWYPPEGGGGGVATHNHNFAVACVRLGHRVTVISQQFRNNVASRDTADGVSILRVPALNLYGGHRLPVVGRQYRFAQAMGYSRKVCSVLEALHQETPVDIAEFVEVNAEGFFWRPTMSKRLAVRCQTPNWVLRRYYLKSEMPFDTGLLGWAERRVIRRAHVVTAPSLDMAHVIAHDCDVPIASIHMIPNAVETGRHPLAVRGDLNDDLNVLFVGRLERAKGVDTLVDAITKVASTESNVRFVFVGKPRNRPGGGTYIDFIMDRLGDLVRQGRVIVKGYLPDDELAQAYAQADIAVVPSLLYESFSYTCAEAMAFGVPVVGSRIGGIPETLDHGRCGILVSPGSVEELADGILALVRDKGLRSTMGNAARSFAVGRFSSERVAGQILNLYESIVSG